VPSYPPAEQARLIAAWEATPRGGKAALAEAEGFSLNRLSDNVKRWSRARQANTCQGPDCANPAPIGQQYCSRRCAGSVHRTADHFTTPIDQFIYNKYRQLGMTRAEFATMVGVSPQCLTNWLKGRCSPKDTTYERIRALFPDAPPAD
jgi:DNA-binding XRE family transcriptional regulator